MKREGLEEWAVVERILPVCWQAQAKQLGALRRCRGFEDARLVTSDVDPSGRWLFAA